ncbi:MAG: D-alanyl-D-alanine carboxypeptidase [Candidimonas sp.]|nr:MAG: D-alanyl-D-alanine carboxypeptidase [Candidimonas sp.]
MRRSFVTCVLALAPTVSLLAVPAASAAQPEAPVKLAAPAPQAGTAPQAAEPPATPTVPVPAAVRGLTPVGELAKVPAPSVDAKAWLVLDANSGQVLGDVDPDEKIEPASLTKMMSTYIVFDALENKRLSLDQKVNVSEKAWRTGGSRMFIKLGTQVSVDDLLQGVIVQSGNDATVALAEAVAGSESAFAALMNQEAQKMGLTNTHYVNSTGLPDPDHYTTVRDLATLARDLVTRFPQYLHYYSEKEFTYNKIKQRNRNRLLWVDSTVDGLKTGHTQSAGYCLVATAKRGDRRLVTVVVGAPSDSARTESSLKMLNWGFQNFDTIKLYDATHAAVQARVWEGTAATVGLGQPGPTWITVPRGEGQLVKPVAQYTQPLIAPLRKGAQVGEVSLTLAGKVLRREPLVVLNDVPQAGFFGRIFDKIRLMFK